MKKTEALVCSPDQAFKLKELGVKQCSTFFYLEVANKEKTRTRRMLGINTEEIYALNQIISHPLMMSIGQPLRAAAFTATELSALSELIFNDELDFDLSEDLEKKYGEREGVQLLFDPEFMADVLLDVIEQKMISVEQVNELL